MLIIEARFYEDISDELAPRRRRASWKARRIEYERIAVPGALEIPLALSSPWPTASWDAPDGIDGCVALGCVIRGETAHYDIVARQSAAA